MATARLTFNETRGYIKALQGNLCCCNAVAVVQSLTIARMTNFAANLPYASLVWGRMSTSCNRDQNPST